MVEPLEIRTRWGVAFRGNRSEVLPAANARTPSTPPQPQHATIICYGRMLINFVQRVAGLPSLLRSLHFMAQNRDSQYDILVVHVKILRQVYCSPFPTSLPMSAC